MKEADIDALNAVFCFIVNFYFIFQVFGLVVWIEIWIAHVAV